jgi:hypothetical protein
MHAEWQPIETAPKDERLLFLDDGWVFLGQWSDFFRNYHPEDRPVELYGEGEGPTHWMPPPPPPIAQSSTLSES